LKGYGKQNTLKMRGKKETESGAPVKERKKEGKKEAGN